jgi:hypothetical protein
MKKGIAVGLTILLIMTLITGLFLPVISEEVTDERSSNSSEQTTASRGSARWSTYKAYYNKTFSIDKDWAADNITVVVFIQTNDQTTKNKEPGGDSGTYKAAEVLQSTMDFLDGNQSTTGTSRKVLGELITATWCGRCPAADGAFDRLLRDTNYFPSKVTLLELHPSSSADFYSTDSKNRAEWYNYANHHPTAIFDGIKCLGGPANSNPNSTTCDTLYKGIINQRQSVQSIIDITTFGQKTGTSGWINASIELLSPTPLRNLKVHFMVVEDVYPYKTSRDAYIRYSLRDHLIPDDFTPPNHPPTIKTTLSDVNFLEDSSDSTGIQLVTAFDDEDLDVLTFYSDRDDNNKENIKVEIDESGNVTFTPDDNWNGEEDITFYGDDGTADPISQTVTVTVANVNDPPIVANLMQDFTMIEDLPIDNKFDLSSVFDDVDMDPTLNVNPQGPLQFTYSGNVNIEVSIENNWVSFEPKHNWNGEETITITATDPNSASVSDDVTIKVTSENDPPELASLIPDVTLNEDERLKDFMDLNEYFSDPDNDSLTYDFETSENFEIKLKNSLVTIEPIDNYWGTEILSFQAIDIMGLPSIYANMTVTVTSVNDAPILNTTDLWTLNTGNVKSSGNLIVIDQNDEISIFVTAYDPADYDEILFSDDTTLFDIDTNTGEISFTPTNDDVGTHKVNISIDDQQLTDNLVWEEFTITVKNVNDAPHTPVITSPEDGETYITDSKIEFLATCDDPDLYIEDSTERLSYEWTTNKSTSALSVDKEFSTKLEPGVHKIILTVNDRANERSSAEVTITVDINRVLDTDLDGVPDYLDEDDDGDGMPDSWELQYSLDPRDPSDASKDLDRDEVSNLDEYLGDDGKPGGDDSSNPKVRSSIPERKFESDDKGGSTFTSTYIIAIIAVVIIVIILITLFILLRRRKRDVEVTGVSSAQALTPETITPTTLDQTIMPTQQPTSPMLSPEMAQLQYQQQMAYYQYLQLQQPLAPTDQIQTQGFIPEGTGQIPTNNLESTASPLPISEELELPSSLEETKLLPGSEQPAVQEPRESPVDQPMAKPEMTTDKTMEITDADTNPQSQETNLEFSGNCPHCGQSIKEGWILCPNCKQML